MNRRACLVLLGAALLGGCSVGPTVVSDTGYEGTWARGNTMTRSTISIAKVGDDYRFRWAKRTTDGRLKVVCEWDGACEESLDGEKIADYRFRVWRDRPDANLMVEVQESRTEPTVFKQHYIDELVVTDGGKVLRSYTIEKDGSKFEFGKGPQRYFDKVADAIADPPRR